MGLRFLTDHCVPNSVVAVLCKVGYEVLRVQDQMSPDAPDSVVIARAQELNCILVSLNGHFSDIVTYPPESYKGIIALQIRNRPETLGILMDRLIHHLASHQEMGDYEGRLLLVEPHRIRLW